MFLFTKDWIEETSLIRSPVKYLKLQTTGAAQQVLTRQIITAAEGVASLTASATTDGRVVDDLTASIETARAKARVRALLVYTGARLGTFGADYALRSTRWWCAAVAGETRAHSVAVLHPALAVGAARWRLARVHWLLLHWTWQTKVITCYSVTLDFML